MILVGSHVGEWVAKRIKAKYHDDDSQALGWEIDGIPTCGVIYENWNHASITAHIAVDGSLNRRFIWAMFDYPFNQLGAGKIIAPIAEYNTEAQRLVERLGFFLECKIADGHPSGDLLLYTITKDQCKWLRSFDYGQR